MAKLKLIYKTRTEFLQEERYTSKGAALSKAFGIVEADSYARHMLWVENAIEAKQFAVAKDGNNLNWVQDTEGFGEPIGSFGGMPLMLDIAFALVDNKLIAFWDMCSMVTHSEAAENFLRMVNPTAKFSNAMNFHNALR